MRPTLQGFAVLLGSLLFAFAFASVGFGQEVKQQPKPKPSEKGVSKGKGTRTHPATAVARKYLTHIGARRWEESVKLIDPLFLREMHEDYVRRVMRTVSIDEEVALLRTVGAERLRDLQAMKPADFYAARQKSNDEASLTPETRRQMAKSSEVEILGAVAESTELVHVLARHTQETLKERLSEMVVISLEKTSGGLWLVAPKHQKMRVTPLIGGTPVPSPK